MRRVSQPVAGARNPQGDPERRPWVKSKPPGDDPHGQEGDHVKQQDMNGPGKAGAWKCEREEWVKGAHEAVKNVTGGRNATRQKWHPTGIKSGADRGIEPVIHGQVILVA